MNFADCKKCGEHTLLLPLHGDKGGPEFCPICAGKWHAEHTRRRKWGRIIIKAMKFYEREGGSWQDFDKMKIAAIAEGWGIDPLGYGPDTIGSEVGDITAELLADTIQLTHPDKHPPERRDLAKRVTQELLALKPFVFPAPKEKPTPMPRDGKSKRRRAPIKEPSQTPAYPCSECADSVPYYYCTPCKAEHDKRRREERERENAKQREQYARRQQWRRRSRSPSKCAECETEFEAKRKDSKYCSHVCRQAAYRRRKSAEANTTPASYLTTATTKNERASA